MLENLGLASDLNAQIPAIDKTGELFIFNFYLTVSALLLNYASYKYNWTPSPPSQ
jgi:hypothetical protein